VVQFKNESKDANSFVWDFGDNVGKSSEKDPLYKYLKPGQYKVTLKSVGAGGEIQTQNQVEVKSLKPTALFSFTMLTNGDVQFKNESKDANSFVWGIEGQSNVLTLKDPKVSFVYNGKYKVKLRAEGFGDFDEIEQTLTITNGKEPAPISDFSFQDLGLGKFRFTNKSINASSYIWDFGDDNGKSTLENPDYTFQENGLFNVKLTSNGKGGTNSKVILTKVTSSFDYFSYTIENKSVFSIIAFNNDSNKPLQNFAEVLIPSNSKVIVKVRSNTGLVPMLKSADPNLQLEYVTIDNKIYTLNAYYFYYEVKFTGNCKPITVITNIKGQKETFNDVGLPSSLNAKLSNLDILEVQAFKNNVNGILNIQIYLKNILIQTKTITDPFESILIKYNSSKKQFEVSNNSPEEWYCGVYNSNKLITGPKGGCYYINSNGNKTYVDRGLCNCN
jgi:PKD repeat protein